MNWLYGSYVPKDIPVEPLNTRRRFELYVRQTYTTWGIYVKTTLFALSDQELLAARHLYILAKAVDLHTSGSHRLLQLGVIGH